MGGRNSPPPSHGPLPPHPPACPPFPPRLIGNELDVPFGPQLNELFSLANLMIDVARDVLTTPQGKWGDTPFLF